MTIYKRWEVEKMKLCKIPQWHDLSLKVIVTNHMPKLGKTEEMSKYLDISGLPNLKP